MILTTLGGHQVAWLERCERPTVRNKRAEGIVQSSLYRPINHTNIEFLLGCVPLIYRALPLSLAHALSLTLSRPYFRWRGWSGESGRQFGTSGRRGSCRAASREIT